MRKFENFEFRTWHEETKTMRYNVTPWQWDFAINKMWHRCTQSTGSGILGSGGNEMKAEVEGVRFDVIMQLTDTKAFKDGKVAPKPDIYEGDIVKFTGAEIGSPIPYGFTGVVIFACGEWLVDGDNNIGFPLWGELSQWELIGNIYQHPNLLKAQPQQQ